MNTMLFCSNSVRSQIQSLATFAAASLLLLCSTSLAWGQATPRPESNLRDENMRQRQMTPAEMRAYEQAAWKANQADPQREAAQMRAPQLPPGFPLQQDEQQYVADLLDYWQKVSDKVKQYKCDFTRWEYDTGSVNLRDPQTNQLYAYQIAAGQIRFSAPGKARFETSQLTQFKGPPTTAGGPADYEPVEGHSMWNRSIHECWVCTGEAVYDFDFVQKRSYETKIPRQLQGNVVESPLPFLFGAKKDEIMRRYWVRYIPKYDTKPNGEKALVENMYWLEVYPKRIEDARMYSKIELVLNAEDFMPRSINMYSPNYNPRKNNYSSRYFLFENRKINGRWQGFKDSMGYFIKPTLPLGWKTVERASAPQSATAPSKVMK
jgi:TIGR03009 family protein